MPNSNSVVAFLTSVVGVPTAHLNPAPVVGVPTNHSSNCKVSKTYHGPRFTPIGAPTRCDHHDTRIIEGYDHTFRGRVDAEVCKACDEVVNQTTIR